MPDPITADEPDRPVASPSDPAADDAGPADPGARRAPRLGPADRIAPYLTRTGRFARIDPLEGRPLPKPARWFGVVGWAGFLAATVLRARRAGEAR